MDILDRLKMDVPVAQAGMGGGLAGPELASAVAHAGGLGTLGWVPADRRCASRFGGCATKRVTARSSSIC